MVLGHQDGWISSISLGVVGRPGGSELTGWVEQAGVECDKRRLRVADVAGASASGQKARRWQGGAQLDAGVCAWGCGWTG